MVSSVLSPKQRAFITAPLARINLLYGSVRSGKTYVSLIRWALYVGSCPPEKRFLMVGATLTTLRRNCLELLCELVGNNFQYSLAQKRGWLFGREVWLEGAADTRAAGKIRGATLQGAYIDELTLVPEEVYAMVLSRLSEPGAVLIATTNPDRPNHYVNMDIIQNANIDRRCTKFLIDDNDFLDFSYKENLKKEYTGVFYRRFIDGDFVNAEGVIFPAFADSPNKWVIQRGKVPTVFQRVEVGFDIGGNGSAYALTATGQGADGIQYKLLSEKTQAGDMNMEDIEELVSDFCERVEAEYGCAVEVINADHVAVIVNSLNDHTRWRCALAVKPPLEDRVFLYSKLLATGRVKFVKGKCDDLIDEMQNLVFDEASGRAIPLDDGTMQIDTWDSNIYSESGYWNYIES